MPLLDLMAAKRWPFALLLLLCVLLLLDQFAGAREERTVHIGQADWVERRSALGRRLRFSPPTKPPHRYNAWSTEHWHVAHLANGRWFQLRKGDNGVLLEGDSVRIAVAPLTQRVLRFQRLGPSTSRERSTGDALEDLVPLPAIIGALAIALLLVDPRKDTALYLRWTTAVIGLVFLLALFAMTWPLMHALGWS